jgi:hypothetical protein
LSSVFRCSWSLSILQQERNSTAIWRKRRGAEGACVDTRQANKDALGRVVAHALSISAAEPSFPVSLLACRQVYMYLSNVLLVLSFGVHACSRHAHYPTRQIATSMMFTPPLKMPADFAGRFAVLRHSRSAPPWRAQYTTKDTRKRVLD